MYGPYRRGGRHTSDGNAQFDLNLKTRDSRWGIRDLEGDSLVDECKEDTLPLETQAVENVNGSFGELILPLGAHSLTGMKLEFARKQDD